METLEAIFTRRSVREFADDPVEAEKLRLVLQAAAASPSGGNLQAWGFVLIQDALRLAALRSLAPGIIGRPVAVVVICLDIGRANRMGGAGGERLAWLDLGLATENMLLAAHAQGLGACPIGSFHREAVATFLELPQEVQPVLLLALGIPKHKPESPGRRSISEVVFSRKWGVPYEG
jgi:nitroreductase